ncbi:ubiquinone biosynthesis protein COQ9 [Stipitochalara longipes BDJ]|nr:ubiquinone biosynthesis protein COQ9 [Stipitochalara longipes BDJ]
MATRTHLTQLRPLLKPNALSFLRPYHSYDHPPPPGPFTPAESSILEAAIPHIPTHGFKHATLSIGASEAGYIDASTNLFPNGAFSLVHYHLYTQRLALAKHQHILSPPLREGEKPIGIGWKVKALTWERLMGNKNIVHRWQEALALIAQPSHLPIALSELSSLADEIWFLSGDISVDTSWYTKRASLSAIYAATELFMTTDKSPDLNDTRQFLERRFEDMQIVGGTVSSVTQWAGFTAKAGLNVLRSKGVRI